MAAKSAVACLLLRSPKAQQGEQRAGVAHKIDITIVRGFFKGTVHVQDHGSTCKTYVCEEDHAEGREKLVEWYS
jgi:hypothetical protein